MISASKDFTTFSLRKRGFTLIELLVVIAIIAVLSVMGIAVFSGVQKGARDSRRKGDIDALAKAYEVQRTSSYIPLTEANFSSGIKPKDPNNTKGEYFNWLPTDGSGFKVCASLEDNPAQACNTPATNCYCKVSTQGTIQSSSSTSYDPSSTQASLGLGGSSSSSCDTNGTLLSGLVGYWKMDDSVTDFSGYGNNGIANTITYSTTVPNNNLKFVKSGFFNGSTSLITVNSASFNLSNHNSFTVSLWVYPSILDGIARRIISESENSNNGYQINFDSVTHSPQFWVKKVGVNYQVRASTVLALNTWYNIVGTFDNNSNTATIYINGTGSTANYPDNGAYAGTFNRLFIGNIDDITSRYWEGLIDDVRIYDHVLSQPEITALYVPYGADCIP